MAHDENNECRAGDRVLIEETRPLSKRKCWRVLDILERSSA
jgi:small subunit ribosomal protein S17